MSEATCENWCGTEYVPGSAYRGQVSGAPGFERWYCTEACRKAGNAAPLNPARTAPEPGNDSGAK